LAQIPQLCCCNFGIWRFRRRRFFHRDRIHRRADRRSDFRPSGSQADVHVRRRALRYLGLRLLRRIVHWLAGDRRPCHHSLIYFAWDSVRSPGSIDRQRTSRHEYATAAHRLVISLPIVGGGLAPFIATALLARDRSGYLVAGYLLACSVISLTAATFMREGTHPDISHDQ